jgi:hypothetical protein
MAEGHNEPCYACGELCNSLTGDPGQWPTMLPAEQSARPFHMRCAAAMMRDAARYRDMRDALYKFGNGTYATFGEPHTDKTLADSEEFDRDFDAEIAREKQS